MNNIEKLIRAVQYYREEGAIIFNVDFQIVALVDEIERLEAVNKQLIAAFYALLEYREHNTLNFQLEKLDDYLIRMKNVIEEPLP